VGIGRVCHPMPTRGGASGRPYADPHTGHPFRLRPRAAAARRAQGVLPRMTSVVAAFPSGAGVLPPLDEPERRWGPGCARPDGRGADPALDASVHAGSASRPARLRRARRLILPATWVFSRRASGLRFVLRTGGGLCASGGCAARCPRVAAPAGVRTSAPAPAAPSGYGRAPLPLAAPRGSSLGSRRLPLLFRRGWVSFDPSMSLNGVGGLAVLGPTAVGRIRLWTRASTPDLPHGLPGCAGHGCGKG